MFQRLVLRPSGSPCRPQKIASFPSAKPDQSWRNLIANNEVFEIALIGMSGIDFIDLF